MDFEGLIKYLEGYELDEKYVNALNHLEFDTGKAKTNKEKEKFFDIFSSNYTIIHPIWQLILCKYIEDKNENVSKYLKMSLSHFYDYWSIEHAKNFAIDLYPWKNEIPFIKSFTWSQSFAASPEHKLSFPNADLEKMYKYYVEYSHSPITPNTTISYKKALPFVSRLSDKSLSYAEWIQILFEWDDQKFAFQTIESKLTENCCNKQFWKAYISEMKNRNLKIMLNILRRYIGLFLSDSEMQEKYQNEMEAIPRNEEFQNLPALEEYFFDDISPSKSANYDFYDAFCAVKRQSLAFPESLIQFMLDSSAPALKFKLFQSCKYLFARKPTPICYHLQISSDFEESKYVEQSLQIRSTNEANFNCLSKLHISNRFEIKCSSNIYSIQKNIIPRLSKCDARFIFISQQVITLKDFKFLVNQCKIEKFWYDNGGIIDNDGKVDFMQILDWLANAHCIHLYFNQKFNFPPITLADLKERTVKIEEFWVAYFCQLLCRKDYCNFIMRNAAPGASFGLGFADSISGGELQSFDEAVWNFTLSILNEKIHEHSEIGYRSDLKAENLEKIRSERRWF